METRLGITSAMYVNEGSYEAPDWLEVDLIGDLQVAGEWQKGESTARRTRVQTNEETVLNLDTTGNIRVDKTDDAYNRLLTAWANGEVLDILVLNGKNDRPNSHGVRFDGKIFNMGEDQSRQNVLFRDFNFGPCASVNLPKVVHVNDAGTLVYEDFGELTGS